MSDPRAPTPGHQAGAFPPADVFLAAPKVVGSFCRIRACCQAGSKSCDTIAPIGATPSVAITVASFVAAQPVPSAVGPPIDRVRAVLDPTGTRLRERSARDGWSARRGPRRPSWDGSSATSMRWPTAWAPSRIGWLGAGLCHPAPRPESLIPSIQPEHCHLGLDRSGILRPNYQRSRWRKSSILYYERGLSRCK